MTTVAMENIDYKEEHRRKTSKPLLWVTMVSIVMLFAGLTSGVIIVRGDLGINYVVIDFPFPFTLSTIIIIASSLAFHLGLVSIKKGNYGLAKVSVVITLLLGLGFVATQYMGWLALIDSGVYAIGSQSNREGSFLYLLTGLHVLHLLGGLISLVVVLVKTMKEKYSLDNMLGMEVSITYWHFLGGLWVYLFFFFRYIIA